MNTHILAIQLKIQKADGTTIEPSYEVHSYDKAQEIIDSTLALAEKNEKISWTIYGTASVN